MNAFEMAARRAKGEIVPSMSEALAIIRNTNRRTLAQEKLRAFVRTELAELAEDDVSNPVANSHLWDGLVSYAPHTERKALRGGRVTKFTRPPLEPNRPTQNGFTRPSIGTRTREMWDACTSFVNSVTHVIPSLPEMKAYAIEKKWDVTTMTINYYRWRRFNGICLYSRKGKLV